MKIFNVSATLLVAGLLAAAPAFAQTPTAEKQKTQDGSSPTTVGPGSKAYKQKSDGDSPTTVGPGSLAYKQRTDGSSPTTVGSGSAAYKQRTQSFSHSDGSPAGVTKQN